VAVWTDVPGAYLFFAPDPSTLIRRFIWKGCRAQPSARACHGSPPTSLCRPLILLSRCFPPSFASQTTHATTLALFQHAGLASRNTCRHVLQHIDICCDISIDMCCEISTCVATCLHVSRHIDRQVLRHVDLCCKMSTCVATCRHASRHVDMCCDRSICVATYRHVLRHIDRHVLRHIDRHVLQHVDLCCNMSTCIATCQHVLRHAPLVWTFVRRACGSC